MINKLEQLEPDGFYHIYNRANGDELLFRNADNYTFFLKRFRDFVSPYVDVYSYCLMPNHFHFLIRVKSENQINLRQLGCNPEGIPLAISKRFSRLFSSYTQAINKAFGRRGSLFMKPFKRIRVSNEVYLKKLIHYIHSNPKEAGLVEGLVDWHYSSFTAIIHDSNSQVMRNEVIEIFGGLDNFKYCHAIEPSISGIQ